MPRRILLLITDLQIGGTPTVVRELATRLHHPPDVIVDVACLAERGPVADQLAERGIRVTALNAKGPRDLAVIARLRRLVRGGGYDTVFSFLIHANAVAAAVACTSRSTRFIQSIQTTQPRPRWHWRVQAIAHHAAECIVVPSESVAQVAREWSSVPSEKILVIPNAVDLSEFEFATDRPLDSPKVRVGFLGRLDPIKRLPDLIEAVMLLGPNVNLNVFGEYPRTRSESGPTELDRAIAEMPERFIWHGPVPRPQEALSGMDVLVLPSAAEGFGLVLIEAMAAGVPVVATNVAGIRDVVRDGITGLLVPVASPAALAAAIRRLIGEPDLRARLTIAARADVAARFTWRAVLPAYRALLHLPTCEQMSTPSGS